MVQVVQITLPVLPGGRRKKTPFIDQKYTYENVTKKIGQAPHNGPKSLILAPQDIPDISGYQLGFGCQCVKAYNNENHVINQKILQIRFVSNLDICKIVIVCPGQHHVKAQVWSFENVREKQK